MGLILSKYEESNNQSNEITFEQDDTVKFAPISTPNRLDPRSPNTNIARTPLQLILSQKSNLNQTPITNNSTPHIVFSIDPRSPTIEFQRTPIVVVESTRNEKHGKLFNKNLENVRKLLINDEIDTKAPTSSIATTPKSTNSKRKSMVGILETNIDFTETHIDDVFQQKLNQSLPKDTEEEVEEDCVGTATNPIQDQSEIPNKTEEEDCSDYDDNNKECPTINITANVKDFDKKLSTLIYEDKTIDDEERIVEKLPKIRENNRTPLAVRNTNREPEKKLTKLRVSDKPKKNSKIPVFKDAHYNRKGVQCENTPPISRITDNIKTKASKWDGDSTLFI